ncbi:hypothetical protein HDU83_001109 [Entophlyctis luteolus]|nr:hypothetical protein HDU83_001109 [Entophlyctis luteolus]
MIGAIARAAPSPVTAAPADERLLLSEAEVNETIVALDEFLDKQERNQQRLHKYIVDDAIQMVSEFGKAREFIKDSIQALATRASEPVNPARIVLADIFTREDAREGLALWLPETDDVDVALRLCDSIRAHIAADNGNAMRTAASDLIKLYSRALEVSISPTDRPDSLAAHIKAISARVSCLTPTPSAPAVDTDAIRLTNALTTIRLIGNWASHTVNSTLGYFKLLEVCSAFGTLAEILPQVFKLHIASKDKKNRQLSETSIRSTESPELTKTVVVEVNGVKITQPAKPGMQMQPQLV